MITIWLSLNSFGCDKHKYAIYLSNNSMAPIPQPLRIPDACTCSNVDQYLLLIIIELVTFAIFYGFLCWYDVSESAATT